MLFKNRVTIQKGIVKDFDNPVGIAITTTANDFDNPVTIIKATIICKD